jgi:flagellar biogenesis protein FliO
MTSLSAVLQEQRNAKPVSTSSLKPIPFRKDSVTNTPEVFGLLLMTLLVLTAFAALTWYARRRGWLDRWVGQNPKSVSKSKVITVLETQRISQKTTIYRINNGDSEYLLAESSVQIQWMPKENFKEPSNDQAAS